MTAEASEAAFLRPIKASAVTEAAEPDRPRVSVIIPTYQRAHLIELTLRSVLEQVDSTCEIIVVDDGSTDGTLARVQAFPQVRIVQQAHAGPSQARNLGLSHARGAYVAFLDSDDYWPAGMLQGLVEALDADAAAGVAMGWSQGVSQDPASGEWRPIPWPSRGLPCCVTGSVFRREVFAQVGGFDVGLQFGEDTDWFKRADECGIRIHRLDQISVMVRRHSNNMTNGKSLVELNVLRVFKKSLDRARSKV